MHIVRIASVYEPDVDALPTEFRAVLTEQDVEAIRIGPEFFAGLAGANSPRWLHELLANCADGGYELQFYSSGNDPYRPYFRFYSGCQPTIGLPRQGDRRSDVPEFLGKIYSVIGCFRENGFDQAGGLHAADGLVPVSKSGIWVEPGGPIDPATAVPFLETFSGSQLCYLSDGGGAWLEAGEFRRVDDLEREVSRYFEAILNGEQI